MGATLDEMTSEEPKINMTPMIDIVFLLIIFFMCLNFKTFENKLPSELPLDQGLFQSPPKPLQALRLQILLLPGHTDKVRIMPDPNYAPFHLVEWRDVRDETGKITASKAMFEEIRDMIVTGWTMVGDKVEIAPDPNVPFEYVALTLDAVHRAKEMKEEVQMSNARTARKAGNIEEAKRIEDKLKKITFMAAPPEGRE